MVTAPVVSPAVRTPSEVMAARSSPETIDHLTHVSHTSSGKRLALYCVLPPVGTVSAPMIVIAVAVTPAFRCGMVSGVSVPP